MAPPREERTVPVGDETEALMAALIEARDEISKVAYDKVKVSDAIWAAIKALKALPSPALDRAQDASLAWRELYREALARVAGLEAREAEHERAVIDIGVTILALRSCDEAGEPVSSRLRAHIRVMEGEWFNVPTPEGARRRATLRADSGEVAPRVIELLAEIQHLAAIGGPHGRTAHAVEHETLTPIMDKAVEALQLLDAWPFPYVAARSGEGEVRAPTDARSTSQRPTAL